MVTMTFSNIYILLIFHFFFLIGFGVVVRNIIIVLIKQKNKNFPKIDASLIRENKNVYPHNN
jgi:ABC-type protease/lipase transport system fused ATPase/permease subunit